MAPRSPSRSSDGGASEHHMRAEPRLLKAIDESKNDDAINVIQSARAASQPIEHLLRIGLMRASERGNNFLAEYLLQNGAKPDGAAGGRVSPLLKAIEKNHVGIVQLLLKFGGNVDVADKQGRTALMTAAWKNHFHILNILLRCKADVNKKDNQGRNVLHNLAADKHCNWGRDVIEVLLRTDIAIDGTEGQDELKRSPLHWAAVTGKKELCEWLILRRANVNAVEVREKTSLHLAVAHQRDDIVELLIHYGADVTAKSDGSWTPLHNACEVGSVKIVRILLASGAGLNAKLLNGMTPLHVAAQAGHLDVVQSRDTFGITPFLRAAQNKRKDIVNLLAPSNHVETLSEDALGACNGFNATIVDFGNFHNENKVRRRTVKPAVSILPKDSKATSFRWIHLPANNMAWVEALLTKAFIEEGASDHRGQQIHSHFMRPLCHSTPRAPKVHEESDFSDGADHGPPQIIVSDSPGLGISVSSHQSSSAGAQEHPPPRAPRRTDTIQTDATLTSNASAPGSDRKHGKGKEKVKKTAKWGGKTPTKQSDHHARQQRKTSQPLTSSGHLRSPGSPGRKDPTASAKGNIFTFMPYLHFETNRRRHEMQEAIIRAQRAKRIERREGRHCPPMLPRASTYDEMLLRAHLSSSNVSLHVRRTTRDQDQVVYRYQMKDQEQGEPFEIDPKIFMVDQLWMWVLGKDLIVTAFPQRWQQPKNDPLNVLDGIIEDINSKTREPVRSIYDLALIITGRCSGVFDRNRQDEDYQFLDMFEASIGNATEAETKLFSEFNDASERASKWLREHRRPNRFSRQLEAQGRDIEHENRRRRTHTHIFSNDSLHDINGDDYRDDDDGPVHTPLFVDKLLDIGAETDLLAETKDIRDELNMIAKVLEDQRSVIPDIEVSITDILREEHKSQQDLKRRIREQIKTIDTHLKDIDRMDKQAERIYKSITDLLDLKQKHANAFEARFARDQAAGTARQSQTIMVFTIVTIIFLPLSFIAAFFTINIREFPHKDPEGEPSLPLSWVSKYMFGISFAVSIPLIATALSLDAISDTFRLIKRYIRDHRKSSKRKGSVSYAGGASNEKLSQHAATSVEYVVDMRPLENMLSVGRSTRAGRRSYETYGSYIGGGTLLPVTSRGTAKTGSHANGGTAAGQRGKIDVEIVATDHQELPTPVERQSTGFRIRRSADVERGF
ncbi:hypothetical protein BU24DRAFT_435191 [Aaosphaeria arxii CBS 175.79]|uniref:Uncharacterized protein n=1 Tax=Aaosphaeria arxii CBS 175.79 TaxID=1450172 RepID=A0A6A5XHW9_9PLEO|nr:uncharacterized protein BU24DRAFT_435191 [Aaosphaeria arxii CBS 175.79]KAF2012838.1 hypothetical protein BU24DRAFT_435191 [Aaosphaeria arxii CBS 175.79]